MIVLGTIHLRRRQIFAILMDGPLQQIIMY